MKHYINTKSEEHIQIVFCIILVILMVTSGAHYLAELFEKNS